MQDKEKTPEELAIEYGDSHSFFIDDRGDTNKAMLATAYLAGYEAARPKWISVKERLPEVDSRVLVYPNTVGESGTALFWFEDKMWQDLEDHTEPWAPRFWQPLPTPPTKED